MPPPTTPPKQPPGDLEVAPASADEPPESLPEVVDTRRQAPKGTVQAFFGGPLPPPQMMDAYKRSSPELFEDIRKSFVVQGDHRRLMEIERHRHVMEQEKAALEIDRLTAERRHEVELKRVDAERHLGEKSITETNDTARKTAAWTTLAIVAICGAAGFCAWKDLKLATAFLAAIPAIGAATVAVRVVRERAAAKQQQQSPQQQQQQLPQQQSPQPPKK